MIVLNVITADLNETNDKKFSNKDGHPLKFPDFARNFIENIFSEFGEKNIIMVDEEVERYILDQIQINSWSLDFAQALKLLRSSINSKKLLNDKINNRVYIVMQQM